MADEMMQQPAEQPAPMAGAQPQAVDREEPQIDDATKKRVTRMCREIMADKEHFKAVFKRMRDDMVYARLGADQEWVTAGNYVVPIIMRHVNQAVAQLYAKNPRAVAKRKKRLDFQLWDGDPRTLQAALMSTTTPSIDPTTGMMMPPDPQAVAMLMEVEQVRQNNIMLDRVGKTLEVLFQHYTDEQEPNFKQQLKQMVRRTKVCGVAYIELGFQRLFEPSPEIQARIADVTNQIAYIEKLAADAQDGEMDPDSAEMAELKSALQTLQSEPDVIAREGPIFDFPRSTEIIPHRRCRQLKGFIGADYITREFTMTADEIQEVYKVDLKNCYTPYTVNEGEGKIIRVEGETDGSQLACVWRVWHKKTGEEFTICDGYPGWLKPPAVPNVRIERFWPIFVLAFNDIEDEKEIYPPSDVYILRHPQNEFNRARQGLREHRVANRPKYFAVKGMLEADDKKHLENHPANAVIELNALGQGVAINQLIQPHQPVPIDPAQYETQSIQQDVLLGVGSQEANLGPTSGATATESSIAEGSRMSSTSSNVDDLDDLLSDLARASSQLMLTELTTETVTRIAGPGAVWPEMSAEDIADELYLDIKAGSSGRPNRAADLANLERGMPYLLQLPGVNPTPLARRYSDLLDIDLDEIIIEGLPSITAMNSMAGTMAAAAAQPGTGDPKTDPGAQGDKGGDNAPKPAQNEPGPQPAFPAPQGPLTGM